MYTDNLSAAALIKLIASESVELQDYEVSTEKLQKIVKTARSWVSANLRDPAYN